ncbi:hypothetical protein M3A49_01105 [Paraburkholderia sp. CNPSo 3076]|uniref:DUF7019 family protein n=1 Tax=Paraburkholderia sp. CNPSo 3076 TaxID=2940936 RepID=UPI0022513AB1|nr:hypothetical protein [Paraburkholderia sp. CNPSo 3076]MCX5538107.1 hypothetical protein [Paraburkholderia sp. CNPSo 3076]
MENYWYISDAKLEILRQTLPRTWSQDLIIKLKFKSPWFEAEVGHRDVKAAVANTKIIYETLLKSGDLLDFSALSEFDSPQFFSFRGHASRMISNEGYWIALHRESSALLLGGSAKHAIGASGTPEGSISPSINPLGAATSLSTQESAESISEKISYVWQEVYRTGGASAPGVVPQVEGVALFAGRFPASKRQLRRAGKLPISNVVVGTPIFVKQVAS